MTDEEKEILREHYKRMEAEAIAEKRWSTCEHRIPTLPFNPYPPQCELGGEATHTCERYKLAEEYAKERQDNG